MTIDSTSSKISYRSEMSVKSQLNHLQTSIVKYSEKARNALDSVRSNFSFSDQEGSNGRSTPPHMAIEYIDLVLIPEGQHLKQQLESIKQWLENYQCQQWTECQGEGVYRKLQFSVDTPMQNLLSCRDNFRKAVAPVEVKTSSQLEHVAKSGSVAVKDVMTTLVKNALEGFVPGGVVECVASVASTDATTSVTEIKNSLYNKQSYAQQILHILHDDLLPQCTEDDFDSDKSSENLGNDSDQQKSKDFRSFFEGARYRPEASITQRVDPTHSNPNFLMPSNGLRSLKGSNSVETIETMTDEGS